MINNDFMIAISVIWLCLFLLFLGTAGMILIERKLLKAGKKLYACENKEPFDALKEHIL